MKPTPEESRNFQASLSDDVMAAPMSSGNAYDPDAKPTTHKYPTGEQWLEVAHAMGATRQGPPLVDGAVGGTPAHVYPDRPPPPPLTWRQKIGARWFRLKHYFFQVELPCERCVYCFDMGKLARIRDANIIYPVVCVERHVREYFDPNKHGVITPTTERARSDAGACGRLPRYFKRKG